MDDEPAGSSDLLAARRSKLESLRAAGVEPFPHTFEGVESIGSVRAAHAELAPGDEKLGPQTNPLATVDG